MSTCPHDTGQPTGCPQCRPPTATLICPRCEEPVAVDVLFCRACGTATTSPFATAERVTIAHPLPPVDLATTRAVFARTPASARTPTGATPPPGVPLVGQARRRRPIPVLIAIGAAAALAVAGVTVTLVRGSSEPSATLTSTSPPQSDGPGQQPSGPPSAAPASAQQVRHALAPLAEVASAMRPLLRAAPQDDRVLAELGRQALRLQQAADEVRPRLLRMDLPEGRRSALLAAVRDAHRLGVLLGRIGTTPSPAGLLAAARAENARAAASEALQKVGAWLPGDPLSLQDSFEPFRTGLATLWSSSG